jgi:hypothetical protein
MPGLVPGIHILAAKRKAWMAGTGPAMTVFVGDEAKNTFSLSSY